LNSDTDIELFSWNGTMKAFTKSFTNLPTNSRGNCQRDEGWEIKPNG
jgi:hypothetical protein